MTHAKFHPGNTPEGDAYTNRYHPTLPMSGLGHRIPRLEELARTYGTRPILPLRLLEAQGEYKQVIDIHTQNLDTAHDNHDVVEGLIAGHGIIRNQMNLAMATRGVWAKTYTVQVPHPNTAQQTAEQLSESLADVYWQLLSPIAIEHRSGFRGRNVEMHEIGPFGEDNRYLQIAQRTIQLLIAHEGEI